MVEFFFSTTIIIIIGQDEFRWSTSVHILPWRRIALISYRCFYSKSVNISATIVIYISFCKQHQSTAHASTGKATIINWNRSNIDFSRRSAFTIEGVRVSHHRNVSSIWRTFVHGRAVSINAIRSNTKISGKKISRYVFNVITRGTTTNMIKHSQH